MDQVLALANLYNNRILGPNCIGVLNPYIHLHTGFYSDNLLQGDIALTSQIDALASSILDRAAKDNFGFSSIVSLSSMSDINISDLIEYFYEDDKTNNIFYLHREYPRYRSIISITTILNCEKPISCFNIEFTNLSSIFH